MNNYNYNTESCVMNDVVLDTKDNNRNTKTTTAITANKQKSSTNYQFVSEKKIHKNDSSAKNIYI